jgi:hypothetical protein
MGFVSFIKGFFKKEEVKPEPQQEIVEIQTVDAPVSVVPTETTGYIVAPDAAAAVTTDVNPQITDAVTQAPKAKKKRYYRPKNKVTKAASNKKVVK